MAKGSQWPLERYLPLLRLRARQLVLQLHLQGWIGGSDLVNETMLKAHLKLAECKAQTEAQRIKWLQQILANVAKDELRKKRGREGNRPKVYSLEDLIEQSSTRWAHEVEDEGSSPSHRVEKAETLLRLASALQQLPEDQADVVILRHLEGLSVVEIAARLQRTEKSVAGLLLRGRRMLRDLLQDGEIGDGP
jgi:RNA polymerase sigma-70 factor (ECF subfamily)